MCMQCVGIVGAGLQAATLVGGPLAVKYHQRIRARLGLPDNSVAALEASSADERAAPAPSPGGHERQRQHAGVRAPQRAASCPQPVS